MRLADYAWHVRAYCNAMDARVLEDGRTVRYTKRPPVELAQAAATALGLAIIRRDDGDELYPMGGFDD